MLKSPILIPAVKELTPSDIFEHIKKSFKNLDIENHGTYLEVVQGNKLNTYKIECVDIRNDKVYLRKQ